MRIGPHSQCGFFVSLHFVSLHILFTFTVFVFWLHSMCGRVDTWKRESEINEPSFWIDTFVESLQDLCGILRWFLICFSAMNDDDGDKDRTRNGMRHQKGIESLSSLIFNQVISFPFQFLHPFNISTHSSFVVRDCNCIFVRLIVIRMFPFLQVNRKLSR